MHGGSFHPPFRHVLQSGTQTFYCFMAVVSLKFGAHPFLNLSFLTKSSEYVVCFCSQFKLCSRESFFRLPVVSDRGTGKRNAQKNLHVSLLLGITSHPGTKTLHTTIFGVHHSTFDLKKCLIFNFLDQSCKHSAM